MFMPVIMSMPMPMVASELDFISKTTTISQKSFGKPQQSEFIPGPIIVYVYVGVYVYAYYAYDCFCVRFYTKDHYNQPEIVRETLAVSIHSRSDYSVCLCLWLILRSIFISRIILISQRSSGRP